MSRTFLLRPTLTALAFIALGAAAASAQARTPASVWTRAGDVRWDSRDGDSDSDRDSDSDSDSDRRYRRGSVYDRDRYPARYPTTRRDYPRTARDVLLGRTRDRDRELDRIHDDWHRRNDRYRGTREWERRHEEMHRELERARRQQRGDLDRRNDRRPSSGAGRASGRAGGVIR